MLNITSGAGLFTGPGPGSDATTVSALRINDIERMESDDVVAKERALTIFLNDTELVTLLCSPSDMEYLAVGFLLAEGFLQQKDDISGLTADRHHGVVRVTRKDDFVPDEILFKRLITSACGRGAAYYSAADARNQPKLDSPVVISTTQIFSLVHEFNRRGILFKATGGVHSAALATSENILVFNNDLGRHNAIDKVFGECLLKDIATKDRVVITSGRTPSEMILKTARGRAPVLISIGATTDLGVRLADDTGVTLIGFARGKGMIIYTNGWRISGD